MALFEGYERRMPQIQPVLDKYGFKDFEDAEAAYNLSKGVDAYAIVEGIQPIAFENAKWAYTLGAAIALKKGVKTAAEAAECIGEGLQAFCIPGSVADQRKVGLGHGNLGAMLLRRRDRVLLPSWPATSPSPPPRAPSASPATPTRSARTPCALSSTAWARTPP